MAFNSLNLFPTALPASFFMNVRNIIPVIPDKPQVGVMYRDIEPLLADTPLMNQVMDFWVEQLERLNVHVVAGLDARGFLFIRELAKRLDARPVMIRKAAKLQTKVYRRSYTYEYGKGECALEITTSAIMEGENVVIIDDLIATGGTLKCAALLVRDDCKANVVALASVVELAYFAARSKILNEFKVLSVVQYDNELDDQSPCHQYVEAQGAVESFAKELDTGSFAPEYKKIVILYYKSMERIAKQMVYFMPFTFELGSISWDVFDDGYPNDHVNVAQIKNKHVLFLFDMHDPASIMTQLSVLKILTHQHPLSVKACIPYYATNTHERVTEKGVVATAHTFANIMSKCLPPTRDGMTPIFIFDMHAEVARFYYDNMTSSPQPLSAIPHLVNILTRIEGQELEKDAGFKLTIMFPDEGSEKRFKTFFHGFECISCTKHKSGKERNLRLNGDEAELRGDNHLIVIVDDLVHSGGTLIKCAKLIHFINQKARISIYTTHGVFEKCAYRQFLPPLNKTLPPIETFYITDSVPKMANILRNHKPFHVISIVPTLAQEIIESCGLNFDQEVEKHRERPIKHVVMSGDSFEKKQGVVLACQSDSYVCEMRKFSNIHMSFAKSAVSNQPKTHGETVTGNFNRLRTGYLKNQENLNTAEWLHSIENGDLYEPPCQFNPLVSKKKEDEEKEKAKENENENNPKMISTTRFDRAFNVVYHVPTKSIVATWSDATPIHEELHRLSAASGFQRTAGDFVPQVFPQLKHSNPKNWQADFRHDGKDRVVLMADAIKLARKLMPFQQF